MTPLRRRLAIAGVLVLVVAALAFTVLCLIATPKLGPRELAEAKGAIARRLAAHEARLDLKGSKSRYLGVLQAARDWNLASRVRNLLAVSPAQPSQSEAKTLAEVTAIVDEFAAVPAQEPFVLSTRAGMVVGELHGLDGLASCVVLRSRMLAGAGDVGTAFALLKKAWRLTHAVQVALPRTYILLAHAVESLAAEHAALAARPELSEAELTAALEGFEGRAPRVEDFDVSVQRLVFRQLEQDLGMLERGQLHDEFAIPVLGRRMLWKRDSLLVRDLRRYQTIDRTSWSALRQALVQGHRDTTIPRELFGNPLFPFLRWHVEEAQRTVDRVRGARWVLALEIARRRAGCYPDSLDALAVADPEGPPVVLHYRRSGDGYVLYTDGPDGVDAGGDPYSDVIVADRSTAPK